jgi:hypothetical protein
MIFHGKQVMFLKSKIETFSIKDGSNSEKILPVNGLSALQQEFMNVFIHAADILNPTKPFIIYSK